MDELTDRVLKEQVDTLAERIVRLDEELKELRKVLSRPDVLARLGLDASDLNPFMAKFMASGTGFKHRLDRDDAIRTARRQKLLDRLERADDLAKLTGKSLGKAWDELPPTSTPSPRTDPSA